MASRLFCFLFFNCSFFLSGGCGDGLGWGRRLRNRTEVKGPEKRV